MLMDHLGNPTTAAHIVEDPTCEQRCHVCNDRSTGTHYGAISCDGCKGFFRRSVRKDHNYRCRFNGNCNVDKSHRNACRACRLKRCILAGMRIDAIQSERDIIGKRKKPSQDGDDATAFIESLMNSEKMCLQLRESVIKSTEQVAYDKGHIVYDPKPRIATLNDVGTSIHQQLVITVEWAKTLEPFKSLSLQDQAALLKANATQLIVLGAAYRSINTEGGVYLANDTYIPIDRAALVGDINAVVVRIVQELVLPMRDLCINSCEYVGLKAVVFFNPYSIAGAPRDSLIAIKRHRQTAMKALRSLQSVEDEECRFGQLLLLLPAVQTLAQQMVEDVQLCRLFQLTNVDSLMQELILHDDSGKNDEPIMEQLKAEATSPATSDH